MELDWMAYTCNPSTGEGRSRRFRSLKSAWDHTMSWRPACEMQGKPYLKKKKTKQKGWKRCLVPVIPATVEAQIEGCQCEVRVGKVSKTLSQKTK
jgi:hypothetical protein